MGKVVKSQWEFGELFPEEQLVKTLTVAELTTQIKRILEKQVGEVRVTGEVSNLRVQSSGHIYFVLKDASAQLNCVLFRGESQVDRSLLEDGRKVVLEGQITVYEPRGTYQLRVNRLELQGIGALQAAFEKLKAKLKAEGLFSLERKRVLPRLPQRIGVVTSPTGAAIRDVLHVIERRNPSLEVILAPCRVQGVGAAAEIASAIELLNEFDAQKAAGSPTPYLDAILVTRGGGSLEDLWPFNEEVVARAIFNSRLPVVSAVGHEIDFTISDFVADVRAATPSAAAEILTEGMYGSSQLLANRQERLRQLVLQQFQRYTIEFARTAQRLQRTHPRRAIEARAQRLDDAVSSLGRCARSGLRQGRQAFLTAAGRLSRLRLSTLVGMRREAVSVKIGRLQELMERQISDRHRRLDAAISGLRLLGPEQVISRGYSITMDEAGRIVRDPKTVRSGQLIRTRLKLGEVVSRVETTDHRKP